MGAVRSLCRTGIVLNNGTVAAMGDVGPAIEAYYRLMSALRPSDPSGDDPASGFGPVTINDGSATIGHADGFRASTSFRVPDTAAGYSLYCMLADMHGRRVFSQVEGQKDVRSGTHRVQFECPPLWLATGLYSLHFKVLFWGTYGSARLESDHVPVDVVGGETRSDALLAPDGRWSIQQDTACC
jgi:hypothetical protein